MKCERAFDESDIPWHSKVNCYRVLIEFISSSDFSVYFRKLYCLIMIMRHFQLYENKDTIKIYLEYFGYFITLSSDNSKILISRVLIFGFWDVSFLVLSKVLHLPFDQIRLI